MNTHREEMNMTGLGLAVVGGALLMTAGLVGPPWVAAQTTMADYTTTPLFAADASVPPNILLVLDNSGSMNRAAYQDASAAKSGKIDQLIVILPK